MKTKTIDNVEYKVNYGTLKAINKFKEFIGEDKFNEILNGVATVDIPFEEEKYNELLNIILTDNEPAFDNNEVPYHHAEALVSFFCEPFAGKYLKQAESTLSGISSLLQKLDPALFKTMMESIRSPMKSGTSSDVVN
jgi:hypothetical protein